MQSCHSCSCGNRRHNCQPMQTLPTLLTDLMSSKYRLTLMALFNPHPSSELDSGLCFTLTHSLTPTLTLLSRPAFSMEVSREASQPTMGGTARDTEECSQLRPLQTLLLQVSAFCNTPTKAVLCRLSKHLQRPFQVILYRCVDFQTPFRLDCFVRLVAQAENDGKRSTATLTC